MEQLRRRTFKRRAGRAKLYGPAAFLALCLALVFAMSIFFRVSRIEVRGNTYYSAEEVISASGIEEDDNLFFINQFSVMSRLFSRLPYVETASVKRYLPNRVIIDITESQALAYIEAEGQNWVIDRSCKLLTQGTESDTAQLIRVSGVTPVEPTVGETLSTGSADELKKEYLCEILDQIQQRGLLGSVTRIDMSDAANPKFDYIGRFTVELGPRGDTEYQFGKLLGVVSQLTENDRGTIDLSLEGARAVFSP